MPIKNYARAERRKARQQGARRRHPDVGPHKRSDAGAKPAPRRASGPWPRCISMANCPAGVNRGGAGRRGGPHTGQGGHLRDWLAEMGPVSVKNRRSPPLTQPFCVRVRPLSASRHTHSPSRIRSRVGNAIRGEACLIEFIHNRHTQHTHRHRTLTHVQMITTPHSQWGR